MKKNIYYVIGILGIAVIAFFIWQKNKPFVPVEDPDKELSGQAYLDYWERLDEEYKKDNYGGETSEETMDLFIEALKAGDLELASKYFVVEKQPFILRDFRVSSNGYITSLISDLERIENKIELSPNEYRFRTYDSEGNAEFSFDLVLNKHTNKWKMYEL